MGHIHETGSSFSLETRGESLCISDSEKCAEQEIFNRIMTAPPVRLK